MCARARHKARSMVTDFFFYLLLGIFFFIFFFIHISRDCGVTRMGEFFELTKRNERWGRKRGNIGKGKVKVLRRDR